MLKLIFLYVRVLTWRKGVIRILSGTVKKLCISTILIFFPLSNDRNAILEHKNGTKIQICLRLLALNSSVPNSVPIHNINQLIS